MSKKEEIPTATTRQAYRQTGKGKVEIQQKKDFRN